MTQLLFLLISLYLSFSWAAKAPTARVQCHNGPIVISIDGKKENYGDYKKFETDAKYYLSKAFSNESCKYQQSDIQLNLETREEVNDSERRCTSDIVGPNLHNNGSFMTRFRQVNMYYLKKPPCPTMTYPYVSTHQSQVKKSEIQKPPTPPKRNSTSSSNNQEVGSEDQSLTNATFCPSCTYKSPSPTVIDKIIKVGNSLKFKQKSNYTCEPQGYDKGMSKERVQKYVREGRMGELISRYSERAQGAIQRAFLAIVDPKKSAEAQEVLKKYGSFDLAISHSLSQKNAKEESQKIKDLFSSVNRKCYKFVKAALSGDYSVLSDEESRRYNKNLLKQECNIGDKKSPGDLALNHREWRTFNKDFSSEIAANSGPELEKRGFINLLDKKYNVAQNYRDVHGKVDEQLLPTGVVVVYQCNKGKKNSNFENFSNPFRGGEDRKSHCMHGDIAIKTSNGFVRNGYKDVSIAASNKYVVVGAYIKPMEE